MNWTIRQQYLNCLALIYSFIQLLLIHYFIQLLLIHSIIQLLLIHSIMQLLLIHSIIQLLLIHYFIQLLIIHSFIQLLLISIYIRFYKKFNDEYNCSILVFNEETECCLVISEFCLYHTRFHVSCTLKIIIIVDLLTWLQNVTPLQNSKNSLVKSKK